MKFQFATQAKAATASSRRRTTASGGNRALAPATASTMTTSAGSNLFARRRQNPGRSMPPVKSSSSSSREVIRKPLRTKNTSTPMNPPCRPAMPPWLTSTSATATARTPSRAGIPALRRCGRSACGATRLARTPTRRLSPIAVSLSAANAFSPEARRAGSGKLLCQPDVLGFQVFLDSFETALTPEPGLLDTAERRRRIGDHTAVHAHHARFNRLRHPQRAVQRPGVDVGRQAVFGVVGRGDALFLGVEPRNRRDRPEHLLGQYPG